MNIFSSLFVNSISFYCFEFQKHKMRLHGRLLSGLSPLGELVGGRDLLSGRDFPQSGTVGGSSGQIAGLAEQKSGPGQQSTIGKSSKNRFS
jgi:hypothetical protein